MIKKYFQMFSLNLRPKFYLGRNVISKLCFERLYETSNFSYKAWFSRNRVSPELSDPSRSLGRSVVAGSIPSSQAILGTKLTPEALLRKTKQNFSSHFHPKYNLGRSIFPVLAVVAAIGLYSCSNKTPKDAVVAKVGNKEITASEFKMNYEFGLSHLKRGKDPKRAYLDFMIKEEVLSQQGYRLGLEKAPAVQNAVKNLENELLIEELFIDEVHSKIKVSDDEIKEALNKSKVSWKFRYWVEPTYAGAERVAGAMRERGYSDVVEDFLDQNSETPLSPKDFESDYVTWLDVPPELLAAIQKLPRGDISSPILLNGVYYIIQITDIRRAGILENEYADKAKSMKTILFYRKVVEEGLKFVDEFLTPKEIVTKGEQFRSLSDALAQWITSNTDVPFIDAVKAASKEQKSLYALQKELDATLVQFKGGSWSVQDYIENELDTAAITANPGDRNAFRNQLNNQIGLSIRNYFMLDESRKRKLDDSENLKQQIADWRDKWVYQESRYNYTKDLAVTTEQMKEYFNNHKQKYIISKDREPTFNEFKSQVKQDTYLDYARNILSAKVDSLAPFIPVEINQAVLDTIKVSESKKSKWMSVQLFKRSTNRPPFPIVDPAWGF